VKYLLDTHIFIWWITDNPKLSPNIRSVVSDDGNELYLSTASIWEMMIKSKLQKLQLTDDPKTFIKEQVKINSINILDVKMEHSLETYELPDIHKDPFDRILIAQAKIEKLTIITTDSYIVEYDVNTY
jgi:PIN domain nuclease of toxin-antitoxin system